MEKTLSKFKEKYDVCNAMTEPKRTLALSKVMDEMAAEYQIPLFNYQSFAEANREVFALYQQISKARDL